MAEAVKEVVEGILAESAPPAEPVVDPVSEPVAEPVEVVKVDEVLVVTEDGKPVEVIQVVEEAPVVKEEPEIKPVTRQGTFAPPPSPEAVDNLTPAGPYEQSVTIPFSD